MTPGQEAIDEQQPIVLQAADARADTTSAQTAHCHSFCCMAAASEHHRKLDAVPTVPNL